MSATIIAFPVKAAPKPLVTHLILEWEPDGTPVKELQQILAIWEEPVTREMLNEHLIRTSPPKGNEHEDLLDTLLTWEPVYLETPDGMICLFLSDDAYMGELH